MTESVEDQVKHMIAFMAQEAREKAQEIRDKADEEFNLEKGRLVSQEKVKITQIYERKEKQVDTEKKIQQSNALNQARLKVLQKQEQLLKGIFDDAAKQLNTVVNDKGKYKDMLSQLLLESLLVLLEPTVEVRVRKEDASVMESVFGKVSGDYKAKTGQNVTISLKKDPLPDSSCGGLEVTSANGKIKVVNTLEKRLNAAIDKILPAIRHQLFGVSGSRSFFD
jgi:vacuolar-type H+-ATPase subunit E/Vma4